jgi:hypothetical protein
MNPPDQFYVTLPSNARLGYRNDNTPSNYESKLPRTYNLEGDWQVALTFIMMPNQMQGKFELTSTTEAYFIMQRPDEKTLYNVIPERLPDLIERRKHIHAIAALTQDFTEPTLLQARRFDIPKGKTFENIKDLVAFLNKEFESKVTPAVNINDIPADHSYFQMKLELKDDKQKIDVTTNTKEYLHKYYILSQTKELGYALGYRSFKHLNSMPELYHGYYFDVSDPRENVASTGIGTVFVYNSRTFRSTK